MPRRKTQKHKGGASYSLSGAPLDYAMLPGSAFTTNPTVAVYDRFPIDPTVNPQVASDLDVFFGSALTRGCGIENISLQVPANMGSNQVGGKRKRGTKRHRGGANDGKPGFLDGANDLGGSLRHHPYMATPYPNFAQSLTNSWQGKTDPVPTSSDPTDFTWKYSNEIPQRPVDLSQWATELGPSPYLMQGIAPPPASQTGGAALRNRRKHTRRQRSRRNTRKHRKTTRGRGRK